MSAAVAIAPELPSLRQRAVRAGAWRIGVYALSQVLRLVTNIILARLLVERDFGLVQICTVVVTGLRMFSEIGIGPAIVQSRRGDDPAFLDTAWSIQIARGAALFATAALVAWPVALLYGAPALTGLLVAVGLGALIDGFNSTAIFTLNRQLAEGRRALLEFATRNLLARVAMIVWALVAPSAWALVGGTLIGGLAYTLGSHLFLPGYRNRLRWDRTSFRELLSFGRWIFIGTVIAFFGQQLDKLMLGKIDDLGVLGVYGIALTLATLPRELVQVIAQIVLFPVMSELGRAQPGRFATQVLRIRAALLPAGVWVTLGVVLAAPLFFEWLYTAEFAAAGWMAPWAALTSWVMILNVTGNQALLARGRTRALAWSGLVRVLGIGAACLGGFALLGLWGFVLGTLVGALLGHFVVQWALEREQVSIWRQDARYSALLVALAGGGAWVATALRAGLGPSCQAAWVVLVIAAVAVWTARRTLPVVRGS